MARKQFVWDEFDITQLLRTGWDNQIINFAKQHAVYKLLKPCSVTSREEKSIESVETLTVDGNKIRGNLPWLFDVYQNILYEKGKQCVREELFLAQNDKYALNLNVQRGNKMRYECHIDSNPLQGVLYVTNHPKGCGGELVVSNDCNALGTSQIDKDCETIYPKSGMFYLFNANENPHYVKPLRKVDDVRVAVTINFYTTSNPESSRPDDLDSHLFKI